MRIEDLEAKVAHDLQRQGALFEQFRQEIGAEILTEVLARFDERLTEQSTELDNRRVLLSDTSPSTNIDRYTGTVVTELAHALKSPLSHLETTLRESGGVFTDATTTSLQREALHSMLTSVELCKAVLSAFRSLSHISVTAPTWSPSSLEAAVVASHDVISAQVGTRTRLHADLPASIPGYSNDYLLALLLPLIENAVEASPSRGAVSIVCRSTDNGHRIAVTNAVVTPVDVAALKVYGRSTKEGHEGIGIAITERLLAADRGATLIPTVTPRGLEMAIELPARRA